MAVVASATGAAVFGLSGVAAGLAGGALLGAGVGALYSGITGDGNILNSALTGGLIGGAVGGIGAAAFGSPAALSAVPTATGGASPALLAAQNATAATTPAQLNAIAAAQGVAPEMAASLPGAGLTAAPATLPSTIAPATIESATSQLGSVKPTTGMDMLGYGLAGTAAMSLLGGMNQKKLSGSNIPGQNPAMIRPYTYNVSQNQSAYPTTPQYGANGLPILPTSEQNYFNQSYTAGTPYKAAVGGLMQAYANGGQVDLHGTFSDGSGQQNQPQSANGYAPAGGQPYGAASFSSPFSAGTSQPSQSGQQLGMASMNPQQTQGGFNPFNSDRMALLRQDPNFLAMQRAQGGGYDSQGNAVDGLGNAIQKSPAQNQSFGQTMQLMRSMNTNRLDDGMVYRGPAQPILTPEQQRIQSANAMANGGLTGYAPGGMADSYNLGNYSDGGRLLKGPGDGVSDDIPAIIGQKQPARLADGEFVIPARIVSEIGNGSTDAGAKRLYAMMDKIQAGRKKTIGKKNVAKDTKAKKHLLG
jgi:hypothetical protein